MGESEQTRPLIVILGHRSTIGLLLSMLAESGFLICARPDEPPESESRRRLALPISSSASRGQVAARVSMSVARRGGGDVQWEIHNGWLTRSEGCYDQTCDIMPSSTVADTMRAMSAASAAFDRHLVQAMSDSIIGLLAERERGR